MQLVHVTLAASSSVYGFSVVLEFAMAPGRTDTRTTGSTCVSGCVIAAGLCTPAWCLSGITADMTSCFFSVYKNWRAPDRSPNSEMNLLPSSTSQACTSFQKFRAKYQPHFLLGTGAGIRHIPDVATSCLLWHPQARPYTLNLEPNNSRKSLLPATLGIPMFNPRRGRLSSRATTTWAVGRSWPFPDSTSAPWLLLHPGGVKRTQAKDMPQVTAGSFLRVRLVGLAWAFLKGVGS